MAMDANVYRYEGLWRVSPYHKTIQSFFIFQTDALRTTSRTECRASTSTTRPSSSRNTRPRWPASWTRRRTTSPKRSRWARSGSYSTAGAPLANTESPRLLNISSSLPSSSAFVPRRPWQTLAAHLKYSSTLDFSQPTGVLLFVGQWDLVVSH